MPWCSSAAFERKVLRRIKVAGTARPRLCATYDYFKVICTCTWHWQNRKRKPGFWNLVASRCLRPTGTRTDTQTRTRESAPSPWSHSARPRLSWACPRVTFALAPAPRSCCQATGPRPVHWSATGSMRWPLGPSSGRNVPPFPIGGPGDGCEKQDRPVHARNADRQLGCPGAPACVLMRISDRGDEHAKHQRFPGSVVPSIVPNRGQTTRGTIPTRLPLGCF